MRILIGYDGSAQSESAIRDLKNAGLPREGEACLMVIVNSLPLSAAAIDPTGTGMLMAGYAAENMEANFTWARQNAQKGKEILSQALPAWSVSTETPLDMPAKAVLEKADAWKPDLIVLGSNGWTWLGDAMVGSTARKIMTHAETNVRLGRARPDTIVRAPRILVAIDGSPDSDATVEEVVKRNWPKGTEAKLVTVMDTRVQFEEAREEDKYPALKNGNRKWPWLEEYLGTCVDKLSARGITATSGIAEGDARTALLEAARSFEPDCIFIGRRGVSGFTRLLLGSVSEAVASHAPCTVEIIRK